MLQSLQSAPSAQRCSVPAGGERPIGTRHAGLRRGQAPGEVRGDRVDRPRCHTVQRVSTGSTRKTESPRLLAATLFLVELRICPLGIRASENTRMEKVPQLLSKFMVPWKNHRHGQMLRLLAEDEVRKVSCGWTAEGVMCQVKVLGLYPYVCDLQSWWVAKDDPEGEGRKY